MAVAAAAAMALVRQGSYVRLRSTTVEHTNPESAPGRRSLWTARPLRLLVPRRAAVSILSYLRIGALCALLAPALALAADKPVVNEKFADLEPAIQMLREE